MFANQHIIRSVGATYHGGLVWYALEYGALRSVYASTACNYSYREFWF